MNTYDNAFIFESIYLIISFLISIVVFYVRVSFKKERSRNVLFFTSIPIMFFHLIVSQHGLCSVFKLFGSASHYTFDESFIKNTAIVFFLITWGLNSNLFWKNNR